MKEVTLIKLALISSIIGIIILYISVENISLNETEINKITYADNDIKIKGVITKLDEREKVTFLEISQPNTMNVVVFKDSKFDLKQNDYVEVIGSVEEYNGKLQIIAEEIKR